MSILITGGMGHVGYELIKHALRAGEDVIAQYHTTFRKKDADALEGNVRWVHCNLSSPAEVEAMSKDPNVVVFILPQFQMIRLLEIIQEKRLW